MENKSKIVDWILNYHNNFNVKITELTGLKKYFPYINDFKIEMTFDNIVFKGRGTSESEQLALEIAFSELIERICVYKYNLKTTSGVSIHSSLLGAETNSRNELIEHDSFLCHFLIGNRPLKLKARIDTLVDGYELESYLLCENNLGYGTLVIAKNLKNDVGLISGTSFNSTLETSLHNSKIECFRDLEYILNNNRQKYLKTIDFKKISTPSFADHGNLSRSPSYLEEYNLATNNSFTLNLTYSETGFSFQQLSLDFLPGNLPLYCVKAENLNLQKMFLGSDNEKNANKTRLKEVCTNFESLNLNKLPHPFN